jgi:hypothetical protein
MKSRPPPPRQAPTVGPIPADGEGRVSIVERPLLTGRIPKMPAPVASDISGGVAPIPVIRSTASEPPESTLGRP